VRGDSSEAAAGQPGERPRYAPRPRHQAMHAATATTRLPPAALPARTRLHLRLGCCTWSYSCYLASPLLLLLLLLLTPVRPLLRRCGRVAPAAIPIHTQHESRKCRVPILELLPRVDAARHVCRPGGKQEAIFTLPTHLRTQAQPTCTALGAGGDSTSRPLPPTAPDEAAQRQPHRHGGSPSRTVASNQAWLPSAQYSLALAIM